MADSCEGVMREAKNDEGQTPESGLALDSEQ
jgi:hypothetical protein